MSNRKSISVNLTADELRILLLYWPGDVEAMGDADANSPNDKIQHIGQSITRKLATANLILRGEV